MKQGDLFGDEGGAPARRPRAKRAPRRASEPGSQPPPEQPAVAPAPSAPAPPARGDGDARRTAVLEFARPLLLEAGAGTGKTATLVARVVHWCVGPGWDEAVSAGEASEPDAVAVAVLRGVVAITFTEAAAAEMSTRVGRALARIQRVTARGALDPSDLPVAFVADALPEPALLHERARALRGALDHFVASTIHAFCRRLLAAYPLEVGFDPDFEVDATFGRTETILREVLEAYLERAWSEPVDEDLIELARRGIDAPQIEQALVSLVEEGARAADFEADPLDDGTCARLVGELRAAVAEALTLVAPLRGIPRNTAGAIEGLDDTVALVASLSGAPRTTFETLLVSLREVWTLDERRWKRVCEWAKGKLNKGEQRALEKDESFDEERFAAVLERCAEAVRPFLELDPPLLRRVRRVIAKTLRVAEDELRRRGVATFSDLLVEAARLLRENPRIAARERRRIRQLLVDEFQDTDEVQCEVVAALGLAPPGSDAAETPCLFLVGDPKQSIFAWRNADLGAYDRFATRVSEAGGERLRLSHNFRSCRAILDEVERAIAPVMEEQLGVQPPFAPLEPARPDADVAGEGPSVEYWLSWPRDEHGVVAPAKIQAASFEVEARAIAADVLEQHARPSARWEHFALIFRSLTQIEPYLQEMRRRGIPYEVQSDRSYYKRREVIDATALVRAVLDPSDHVALLTLLRSPLVGMPDAALLPLWSEELPKLLSRLRKADEEQLAEIEACVRRAAQRVPRSIPGIEHVEGWPESVVAATRAIGRCRAGFRTLPADEWVESLRAELAPEAAEAARFLGAYRLANLRRFFRALLAALEERGGDVHGVVRALRANLAREDRTEASRPADSGQDAVQVLTIHGAKGLEYRHVYVAQAHKMGFRGESEGNAFDRRGAVAYRVLGCPNPAWFESKRQRELAEAAERVRLLYVALTRARDRLVVVGSFRHDDKRPGWRRAGHFVDLLHHRAATDAALAGVYGLADREDEASFVDGAGATWRLAARIGEAGGAQGERGAGDGRDDAPVEPERIERESQMLAADRAAAARRMARPYSSVASAEAHGEASERRAGARFSEGAAGGTASVLGASGPGVRRELAQIAGTAVHRVLERFDLGAEPAEELARWRERVPALVAEQLAGDDAEAATARALALCDALATNGTLARLVALRERVVARELPVLAPIDDDVAGDCADAAVGFVSGAIDLVYADEDGRLVVVDYKTDRVGGAELDARAATYRAQGRVYVESLADALGLAADRTPRFELWFLDSGAVWRA